MPVPRAPCPATGVVPYEIEDVPGAPHVRVGDELNSTYGGIQNSALNAMFYIEQVSSVRFVRRNSEPNFVRFVRDSSPCDGSSNFGVCGGMQEIHIPHIGCYQVDTRRTFAGTPILLASLDPEPLAGYVRRAAHRAAAARRRAPGPLQSECASEGRLHHSRRRVAAIEAAHRCCGSPATVTLLWTSCSVGMATHETMHALGLFHTQAYPNRDAFVQIHWDNIKGMTPSGVVGTEQYEMIPFDTFKDPKQAEVAAMPFDFESVLIYMDTACAKSCPEST